MSQYFRVDQQVVWNPSNGVALLFVRTSEALRPLTDMPTGLASEIPDEWAIDLPVFEKFIDALVTRYQQSTHLILRSLMEGFIATSLVLIERGGGNVPALQTAPGPDVSDVQVSADGLSPGPAPGRLEELRNTHSSAMPL